MSQAGVVNVSGGGGGGSPVQTLTFDTGGAVPPTANNINILSASSTNNNNNGIIINGNAGTSTGTVTLTNRYQQNTTTAGAVNSTVTILPALAAGTYVFDMSVAAYATLGGPDGNGYTIVGAVLSTGVAATLLPNQQKDSFEQNPGANAVLGVSGNSVTVTVTGSAGLNFDWNVSGTYITVS